MQRLAILAALLLAACHAPGDLSHDTDQPLTETVPVAGWTPTHGFWAYRKWPTLVLDEAGSCPVEAVEAALAPFHEAGIEIGYESGECRPAFFRVEDGRVCLQVDDDGLWEAEAAGEAYWRTRKGTDQIVEGGIRVMSSCNPMVIAHEVGHVLGLGHSEDVEHTMYPAESDVLSFGDVDLQAIVARREAHLTAPK